MFPVNNPTPSTLPPPPKKKNPNNEMPTKTTVIIHVKIIQNFVHLTEKQK